MDISFSRLFAAGVAIVALGVAVVIWALPGNQSGIGTPTVPKKTQQMIDVRPAATVPPPAPPGVPSYQYNDRGQVMLILYSDGSTYSYSYDSHGDKTCETDRSGRTWVYVYDQHQHPITVIDPERHVTQLAAPAAGP